MTGETAKKFSYNTVTLPDVYSLNACIEQKEDIVHVTNTLNNKISELEYKLEKLETKYTALLNICEKNFPSEVELYFEIYGKGNE